MTGKKNLSIWMLCLLLAYASLSYAAEGERKIQLSGLILDPSFKSLSVKQLESHFELETATLFNPWDKKQATYRGVCLRDLLEKLATPQTETVVFKAIDGYEVEITRSDWEKYRIILVTQESGHYLPVAQKGPLRIIFPDYNPNNKHYESNLHLWAWMINRIEFR